AAGKAIDIIGGYGCAAAIKVYNFRIPCREAILSELHIKRRVGRRTCFHIAFEVGFAVIEYYCMGVIGIYYPITVAIRVFVVHAASEAAIPVFAGLALPESSS